MSSPGFFEFDTALPNFGEEKSILDEDFDICNDETFGQPGLGDEAWDEDANADIIEEIEKERVPRESESDHRNEKVSNSDDDDFEPTYITESIQQMILDDENEDNFNASQIPLDDPAIVSVPRSRPLSIKEKRSISPSFCLPELDNYGSPYKTSIWAPPTSASSKSHEDDRMKLPPGLRGGPDVVRGRVDPKNAAGLHAKSSVGFHQAQKPHLIPSSRPPPLEDPSVLTALPMSVRGMPSSSHPLVPIKIVAQPKTLAELEQEMLADPQTKASQFSRPSNQTHVVHGMPHAELHAMRHIMRPGQAPGHIFGGPPMYMRFQGPPPGMVPSRGRGILAAGPVPGQIRPGVPGVVRPVPIDGRSGGTYPGHGPIPAQVSLLGPVPFGHQQPEQHRPREPVDKYAGLMSMKDRTWLVNIQLSQLFTPNPYIDDYYYTMHELKKSKKPLSPAKSLEEENNAMSKAMAEKVVLLGLKESTNPTPGNSYAPPVVEKSLGRIQVASALAPRKIVDVATVTSRSQHSILLLIENVFPHLLELEDLRRQAGLLEEGEVKQSALSRLSRHMTITNAIASLHDKAVLGAVMSVNKGRRLVERLVSFPALGAAIGPIVVESAMCNLSVSFPFRSKGDREALILSLTSSTCVGSFGHEQVAGLLKSFLRDPTLLATVIANSTGLSILLAVLHRAALIVEATRMSLASSNQPVTNPAVLAQLKPCEELLDTGKAISRVLLSTSASPAVTMPSGAAGRIANVFDLPPNAARDLETRFGSSPAVKNSAGARTEEKTHATIVQALSGVRTALPQPSMPRMNANDSPASKNAVLAAFANRSWSGSSSAAPPMPMLHQAPRRSPRIPGVTPPLIDLGTPGPTPPPSEMDSTPVLVPLKSLPGSPGLGSR